MKILAQRTMRKLEKYTLFLCMYLSANIPRKGAPTSTPAVKTDIASYLNIILKLFQQKWHLYITSPWCFRSQTRSHSDTMLGSSPFSNLNSNRVQEFLSECLKPLTKLSQTTFKDQWFQAHRQAGCSSRGCCRLRGKRRRGGGKDCVC